MYPMPALLPEQLSAPARALYDRSVRSYERLVPTDDQSAAREIAAAGLGSYFAAEEGGRGWLQATPLHEQFSAVSVEHTANSGWRASVEVASIDAEDVWVESRGMHLLALLDGASYEPQTVQRGGLPMVRVSCRHRTATDFEHDSAYLADFTLVNPSAPVLDPAHPGQVSLWATVVSARLYPFATDYLAQSDGDTTAGTCDGVGGEQPHPFIAFRPPARTELDALAGTLVKLTLYPLALALAEQSGERCPRHGGATGDDPDCPCSLT